jgi:hypothetical protein
MAVSRPGYEQYCRHQHEIDRKVTAWARAVENYYWPLGTTPTRDTSPIQNNLVSFNRQQADDAQNRIKATFDELEQAGELPEQITARAKAIAQRARVSQQTLYKHLSLWHPHHQVGVMNQVASLSEPQQPPAEEPPKSPDPLVSEVLHPIGENMKRKAPCAGLFGSDPKIFSPERGVRGDESQFPQVVPPLIWSYRYRSNTGCICWGGLMK